jgi:hypothetical protein
MLEKIKTYSFFILMSVLFVFLNKWLCSDFLFDFLKKDLIVILIALLAINTTTVSVIMTKLKEIAEKNNVDFSSTILELKQSIVEQVIYIIVAIIVMMLLGSKLVLDIHESSETVLQICLLSIFSAAMYNLYDTASSIFIILKHENNK